MIPNFITGAAKVVGNAALGTVKLAGKSAAITVGIVGGIALTGFVAEKALAAVKRHKDDSGADDSVSSEAAKSDTEQSGKPVSPESSGCSKTDSTIKDFMERVKAHESDEAKKAPEQSNEQLSSTPTTDRDGVHETIITAAKESPVVPVTEVSKEDKKD